MINIRTIAYAAAAVSLMSTNSALANCYFASDWDDGGEKFALSGGQCALLDMSENKPDGFCQNHPQATQRRDDFGKQLSSFRMDSGYAVSYKIYNGDTPTVVISPQAIPQMGPDINDKIVAVACMKY